MDALRRMMEGQDPHANVFGTFPPNQWAHLAEEHQPDYAAIGRENIEMEENAKNMQLLMDAEIDLRVKAEQRANRAEAEVETAQRVAQEAQAQCSELKALVRQQEEALQTPLPMGEAASLREALAAAKIHMQELEDTRANAMQSVEAKQAELGAAQEQVEQLRTKLQAAEGCIKELQAQLVAARMAEMQIAKKAECGVTLAAEYNKDLCSALTDLFGLNHRISGAAQKGVVSAIKGVPLHSMLHELAGPETPSEQELTRIAAAPKPSGAQGYLLGVLYSPVAAAQGSGAVPASSGNTAVPAADGSASVPGAAALAIQYKPPPNKNLQYDSISKGSTVAFFPGPIKDSAAAFHSMRDRHLLDGSKEKTGTKMVKGLEAGLTDGACVRWAFAEAKLGGNGQPDWEQLRWQPLKLAQVAAAAAAEEQDQA